MKRISYLSTSGDTFIAPIMKHLAARYEVQAIVEEGQQAVSWPDYGTDLLWVEWCDQAAVDVTRAPKVCPIIVRLHSFEAFTDYPANVDWSKVDVLVFVAEHVRDYALEQFAIEGPEVVVIPNGVDFERFTIPEGKVYGKRVAWVGGISHKKGPMLFVQACKAIHDFDPEFTFHVAGEFQDRRYEAYFDHILPLLGLSEAVHFDGKVDPEKMPEWYADKDYILSTSPWESFQYAVAEGMACGLRPLVHSWPGADMLWGDTGIVWENLSHVWLRTTPENVEGYLYGCDGAVGDEGLDRRAMIQKHLSLPARLADLDALVDRVIERPAEWRQTVACCMVVKGDDPRFAKALHSIEGVFDEVCVFVDTREGEQNLKMLDAGLGNDDVIFDHGTPDTYHDCIDFSAMRNRVAALTTSDWVFVLDSDEVLKNARILPFLIAEAHAKGHEALAVKVDCYTDQGLTESGMDIRAYRRDACRYRYPVHNQLTGQKNVYGCPDVVIQSTYVGGLQERCDRSIPPLLAMWDDPDYQGDEEKKHAAFFLTRMYAAGAQFDGVDEWAAVCEELCPKDDFAAPFWSFWTGSKLARGELDEAKAIIRRALEHHPRHIDQKWYEAVTALVEWSNAASDQRNFVGVPMRSRQYLPNLLDAAKMLGMPIVGKEVRG